MRRELNWLVAVAVLTGAAACTGDDDAAVVVTTAVATTTPATGAPADTDPGVPPTSEPGPERAVTPLPGLLDASDAPIENDPAVVTGTLDNGLRYYVRHNDQPGGHAALRLAVKAGSADELGPETGVAHFLEHMLFNGTERYPENELIDVLRGFGAAFGADVNAYTSYDETVYELDVPSDPESLATAIDVLDQWLGHATINEADVIAERGVVLDEWRGGQNSFGRLYELASAHYHAGTRYEGRNPIGTSDSIGSMTPEVLRAFYDTWYRPDNVAVVVTGDIDVDAVAAQIEARFGDTVSRTPAAPVQRPPGIEPFPEPGFVLHSDPDQTTVDVEVTLPLPAPEGEGTAAGRARLLDAVVFDVLVRRLSRDAAGGDAPFDQAAPGSNSYVGAMDAPALYTFTAAARAGATLRAVLDEYERAYRFGFDSGELRVSVAALRATYESQLAAATEVQDAEYADAFVANFLDGAAYPTRAAGAEWALAELDAVTPEAVGERFNARYTNTAAQVIISTPEGLAGDVPTEADVLAAIAATPDRELERRSSSAALPDTLMERPEPVEPSGERHLTDAGWELFDPVEYTFPNGVRVIVTPNDIVQGDVYLQASSPGGTALVADADVIDALFAAEIVTTSGAGELSRSDLADIVSSFDIELTADLQPYTEGWWGRAATTDVEQLLQLVNLYMTEPTVDPVALNQTVQWNQPLIDDPSRDPGTASAAALNDARYGGELRYSVLPGPDAFATLDADGVERVWRDRFGDASDWVFVFSGDVDPGELVELAGAYLGTLPGGRPAEQPASVTPPPPAQAVSVQVRAGTGDTASLEMLITAPAGRLHAADDAVARVASGVLQNRLTRVVREEYGDSYSPYVVTWVDEDPDPVALTYVHATGAPDRIEAIALTVVEQLTELVGGGFTEAELDTAKAPVLQQYQYVDNGQFLAQLTRAAWHPDYDLSAYVYEDATEVTRSAVAAYLAEHVPPQQFVAAITTPR